MVSPIWENLYGDFHSMVDEYIGENTNRIKRFFDTQKRSQETHNAIRSYFIRNEVGLIKDKKGNMNPDREGMVVNSNQFENEAVNYLKQSQTRAIQTVNNRIFVYEPGERYMTHNFSLKEFGISDFAGATLIPSRTRLKTV